MKQEVIKKQIGKEKKYHITFPTYKRKPIFINEKIRDWMEIEIIKIAKEKGIKIFALII